MKILPKELTPELLRLVLPDKNIGSLSINNNILWFDAEPEKHKPSIKWSDISINIDTLIKEIRKKILSFDYELKINYKKDLISIDLCKDDVSLFEAYAYKDELEAFVVVAEWVAKEKGLLI